MTEDQIKAIPRRTAEQVLVAVPGGPGYEHRVLLAVEIAMNEEWWRGYWASGREMAHQEELGPKAPAFAPQQ